MARSSRLLAALLGVFRTRTASRRSATGRTGVRRPSVPAPSRTKSAASSAGTAEVDPRSLGRVVLEWTPSADGVPDPGEIVWTWVPYEENDGRGKDRPVLVVAVLRGDVIIGIQLTSKPHDGDPDHVSVGTGAWDGEHRESWARVDRVFRVDVGSVRREASFLPEKAYRAVARVLVARYGWSAA